MKIFEVITESTQIIAERLGTLSQLNAGPLINVLRQTAYSGRGGKRDYGPSITPMSNTFKTSSIGSTSPIIDAGKITSIADLRKAYRNASKSDDQEAQGFALYIGNDTVALGTFDQHTLAGASRVGAIAWDFAKFQDAFDSALGQLNADKQSWNRTSLPVTSAREKQERDYSTNWDYTGDAPTKTVKYTGAAKTTAELSTVINLAIAVAQAVNQPLMAKLILIDVEARQKRNTRSQIRYELSKTGESLKARVAKYKLSKRPTAKNIKEFVDAVMERKLSQIQFAGSAYKLTPYADAITADKLFSGVPFRVRYATVTPGEYGSVYITYSFTNGSLTPLIASYVLRENGKQTSVDEAIDVDLYARKILKIKDPSDKSVSVKLLLTFLKDQKFKDLKMSLNVFKQLHPEWPELAVIEKSMKAELENQKKQ